MQFDRAKILEATQSVIDRLIVELDTLERRKQAAVNMRQKAMDSIHAIVSKNIKAQLSKGKNLPEMTNLYPEGGDVYSASIGFKFTLTKSQAAKYKAATDSTANQLDTEIRALERRIHYFSRYKQTIGLASGDSITTSNKNMLSYFIEDLISEVK